MPVLPPRLINIPQANGAGNAFEEINISGSNLVLQTDNIGILYGNTVVPSSSYAASSIYSISASYALSALSSSYASNAGAAPLPINGGNEIDAINGDSQTIEAGQVVRFISGSSSGTVIIDMPIAGIHDGDNKYKNTALGIAKETIYSGSKGKIVTKGYVQYLNTSTFSNGDILYLKPVISGAYNYGAVTNIRPTPPTDIIKVGYVVLSDNGGGVIYVDINRSLGFEDIVNISSSKTPANNSILVYNTSSNAWVDKLQDVYWTPTGSNNIFYSKGNVGIGDIDPMYSLQVSGTIAPIGDGIFSLGDPSNRFNDLYALQTTVGAFFEVGLRTENIGKNPTGTIVVWKNGKLIPCDSDENELVMGVIKEGKDEPIILGAETILVTGIIKEGDYIVTSSKKGHGKAVKIGKFFKKNLFGKVIAQALESSNEDSKLIKAMIRKM